MAASSASCRLLIGYPHAAARVTLSCIKRKRIGRVDSGEVRHSTCKFGAGDTRFDRLQIKGHLAT
jgi:acetoacetate decarboxylase